jgi:hypothetical protein
MSEGEKSNEVEQLAEAYRSMMDEFNATIKDIAGRYSSGLCPPGVLPPLKHAENPVCLLRLEQLEKTVEEHKRAIRGGNGEKPGVVGDLQVLNNRLLALEKSHSELQKVLTGIAVTVLLTLITTVMNLVIR